LTGLDEETRQSIDATVATVKAACSDPVIAIDVYFPGDHSDPVKHQGLAPGDVFALDRRRVKEADILVVLAHAPSTGVGQEVNMAFESLLPIVLLVPVGAVVSRMLRGVASYKVEISYRSEEGLRHELGRVLVDLRPRLETRRRAFARLDANVVGANVRAHRHRRQLTREHVADATGMTVAALTSLEESPDRQSDPSLTQLRRLADVLGTAVADLV
jgi:DNA-binding XRE family transcriptional regulator